MGDEARRLREARRAIARRLALCWPHCEHVRPSVLHPAPSDRAFIHAATSLQDEGLIMFDALLIGAGAEPEIRDALLTRKGQFWAVDQKI